MKKVIRNYSDELSRFIDSYPIITKLDEVIPIKVQIINKDMEHNTVKVILDGKLEGPIIVFVQADDKYLCNRNKAIELKLKVNEFEEGDFIYDSVYKDIGIFHKYSEDFNEVTEKIQFLDGILFYDVVCRCSYHMRLATNEEIQSLLAVLKNCNKIWNAKEKRLETWRFEKGDPVLVSNTEGLSKYLAVFLRYTDSSKTIVKTSLGNFRYCTDFYDNEKLFKIIMPKDIDDTV